MSPNRVFATLLTKTSYLPATLVLDYTLKSVSSKYSLLVLVTSSLPEVSLDVLRKRGIATKAIEKLEPNRGLHQLSAHDIRFNDTWTKLRAFELVEYERVVLLDSDMIVMRNMDELFDLELSKDWIAAAHACACNPRKLKHYPADWVPENCAYTPLVHPAALSSPTPIKADSPRPYNLLNSGLVVLTPSEQLMTAITQFLSTSPLVPTFTFPDQDLLAAFFKGRWKPLPWCYNALKTLRIIHKPLWRDEEIRCLHYILHDKPWHFRPGELTGDSKPYEAMHGWWWQRFYELEKEMRESDPVGWELISSSVGSADAASGR